MQRARQEMYEKNNMKPILTEEEFEKLAELGVSDRSRVIKRDSQEQNSP